MAYHINEELGDIYYEVIGDQLILKIRDGILGRGCDIYIIKEDDATVPSDDTVFSSKRTIQEIENRIPEAGEGGYWEMKEDSSGNKYIYTKYPMATQYGATFYAGTPIEVGSIYDGLPIDNDTIYWQEYENGVKILKAKGGGEGGTFDSAEMWRLLGANTTEQINYSHISTAFESFKNEFKNTFVTVGEPEQEISRVKHFLQGLSIGANKHKLYEKDGVVYLDGDLAVTGGITQYALGDTPVSTIMDGVVTDNVTIKKENGKLIVIGGSGSSFDKTAMWAALAANTTEPIHKSHLTTVLQGYATESWANSNFLGKTDKAVDSDKVDGIHANGFCRAYSASYSFGDNQNLITTAQFVEKLKSLGAFNQPYWMCKGSWYYAGNQIISDSGYGNIQLAGAVVEFMGHEGAYTIRITTAPATTNGVRNSIFIYQNHGESYEPRWIKVASTFDNVYSADKLSVYNSNNVNNPNWDEYKATIENFGGSATGIPPVGDNANSVLNIPMSKHGTNKMYGFQMAFCSQNEEIFARAWQSGNIGSWYRIPMVVSGRLKKGFSSVECTDWFRSHGNTGWYSETWGGGWFMSDSTYIRTYDNKAVVALRYDADQGLSGSSWNNGDAAFSVRIHNNENQTPLLLAYRNSTADTGENRLFALELLNSGKQLAFGMGGKAVMSLSNRGGVECSSVTTNYNNSGWEDEYSIYYSPFWQNRNVMDYSKYRYILGWEDSCPQGWNTGYGIGTYRTSKNEWGSMIFEVCQYEATKTRKAQMELRGKDNTLWLSGNLLATGGITQYSDQRAKTIIEQITLSLKDIAQSPAIRFKWNGWKQQDDGKTHIGGIAQYVQTILPEVIYNSDGAFTMDYATTGYIFSVNTAKHLLNYETKTDKEINKLKERIRYLENQLKKLGYEEADIVDN